MPLLNLDDAETSVLKTAVTEYIEKRMTRSSSYERKAFASEEDAFVVVRVGPEDPNIETAMGIRRRL